MLKVKKKILKNTNKNQEDEITQFQTEIKYSIKNLYISDQKKKRKQLTNMHSFLQKLEENMLNCTKKTTKN